MLQNIIRSWNEMSLYRKVRRVFMIGLIIFGLWALTPYLYNRQVNEAFPVAQAPAMAEQPTAMPAMAEQPTAMPAMAEQPTAAPAMAEKPTDAPAIAEQPTTAAAMAEKPTDAPAMAEQPTAMPAMAEKPTDAPAMAEPPTDAPAMAEQPTSAPAVVEPPAAPAGPVAVQTGSFIPGSTPGDRATGSATIYRLEDGQLVLRLENLDVTNGPDLFVVLSGAANPDQEGVKSGAFIQLAALKGNQGSQNYELPADFDLAAYRSAVIWCRAFNIVFGYAPLQSAEN